MGAFQDILGAVTPFLGPIGGVVGDLLGGASAQKSSQQEDQLQQEQWARDDSSVQRKVADLKAAGLAPQLAGGGGEPSSSPIQAQAGIQDQEKADQSTSNMVRQLMSAPQQIAQSEAEKERLAQLKMENDNKARQNWEDNSFSNFLVNPKTGRIAVVTKDPVSGVETVDDPEAMPVWQAERIGKLKTLYNDADTKAKAAEGTAARGQGTFELSRAEAEEILKNKDQRPFGLSDQNWGALLDMAKNVIGTTLHLVGE